MKSHPTGKTDYLKAELFQINIHHKFNRTMIKYTVLESTESTKTLKFGSNRGHFWFNRK